jgi:spore maturation protein CgeB
LRIFQVLGASATGGVNSSQIWLRNLYEPLLDLGHDVYLFRAEEGALARTKRDAKLRTSFSDKLMDNLKKEHSRQPFALFFSYLMDGMVDTAVIDEIRKTGIPTCNFSCNNTHQFDLVDEISPHFDYNLHSEKYVADKFRRIGANPVWFPMAANPKYYKPYGLPRIYDVTFVGQRYARRPFYIWHLLENGISVDVFGPGWQLNRQKFLGEILRNMSRYLLAIKATMATRDNMRADYSARLAWLDFADQLRRKHGSHMHSPLSDEDMILLYSKSQISLGFLEVYNEHNPAAIVKQHLHLRDFEAPMCGALYITGFCEELTEFYEPDKEVLVYHSENELLDKLRYYLKHESQAEKVREAGHIRALTCHTYQHRYEQLFATIGVQKSSCRKSA